MEPETENPPYDLPVHGVVEERTVTRGVGFWLSIWSILTVGSLLGHWAMGWSLLDSTTFVTLGMEAFLLFLMYSPTFFSGFIKIDKIGVQSENAGQKYAWAWSDIADAKIVVQGTRGPPTANLLILPRGASSDGWVLLNNGGLDGWRLLATVKRELHARRTGLEVK